MALLFFNVVSSGAAGGVMTSICVFHAGTDEISSRTLIANTVFNYLSPYCVSCVLQRRYSVFDNNNK